MNPFSVFPEDDPIHPVLKELAALTTECESMSEDDPRSVYARSQLEKKFLELEAIADQTGKRTEIGQLLAFYKNRATVEAEKQRRREEAEQQPGGAGWIAKTNQGFRDGVDGIKLNLRR